MRLLQGPVSAVQCLHIPTSRLLVRAHLPTQHLVSARLSSRTLVPASLFLDTQSWGRAARSSKFERRKSLFVCMGTLAPVEVLVKAAVGLPDKLGDCPFSQRVLITLEEKNIPYDIKYVDTSNKPEWFLEANPEGKVPVIRDDGKWVADSDVITGLLEEKFPDRSLSAPPTPLGSKLFGAFIGFLKSKDPNDGKEQALVDELTQLDTHLKSNGPYLNGENFSSLDVALAPKLYHLKVALGHYKKWSIPAELASLNSYIEAVHSRESFVKTKAPPEFVISGWKSKVNGA